MRDGKAIQIVFTQGITLDVCKAYGHREAIVEFETQEEANNFIERVKAKDKEALARLDEDYDVLLDDYSINGWDDFEDWEV